MAKIKRTLFFLSLLIAFSNTQAQVNTLTEGFESWPPTGWTNHVLAAGVGWMRSWQSPSVAAHSGSHSAHPFINNGQCNSWLVSPPIIISSSNYELSYWERFDAIQYYNNSRVLISTGSANPTSGDFQVLYQQTDTSTSWIQRNISLAAYVGDTIHLAFQYRGTWHLWFVDDLAVEPNSFTDGELDLMVNPTGVSTTPGVENVIVSLVNNGSTTIDTASIHWDVNGAAQSTFSSNTLNLLPGNSMSITLGSYSFNSPNNYAIRAILDLADDFSPINDTLISNYAISSLKDGKLTWVSPEGMVPLVGMRDVGVRIENTGNNLIDSAQVFWKVNGVSQSPFMARGLNLNRGDGAEFTIGQYNFPKGIHEVTASLFVIGDTNALNDSYLSYAAVDTFWESFEGYHFPPENWSINFGVRDNINFGIPPHGNYYYSALPDSNFFGVVSDTLFTPLLDIAVGDQLRFRMESSAFLAANTRVIWKDGSTGAIHFMQNVITTPSSWQQVTVNLSAAAGTNYIGIVAWRNGAGHNKMDLFTSDARLHVNNQDLAIQNGDIYFLARKGQSTDFPVKIKNKGSLPVNGSAYTVKLMEGSGTTLATVNGQNIAPLEEMTLHISHTFSAYGFHDLYFEIDYSLDENLSDNTFRKTEVHVVPASVILKANGEPNSISLNFPFNANGNTQTLGEDDLSQTLYLDSELATTGNIYGMIYTYDNILYSRHPKHLPIKIWASQTQVQNLNGGWVPGNQLILVYDDTLEILPGTGREVYIPFDQPITYTGIGNLVIQDYVYDPEWPPSILRMYAVDKPFPGPTRTVAVMDYFALDPANPPVSYYASEDMAYTRFVIEPVQDTGLVSGTVFDRNNMPLGGATVSVPGTGISVSTDGMGQYTLPYLPHNTYDIKADLFAYKDTTISVILDTAALTQDFYLRERAIVNAGGRVFGSNAPSVPLEFVVVSASGYVPSTASTDGMGRYVLQNIFSDADYEITYSLYGYYDTTVVVRVANGNIILGDIVLKQEHISPYDVLAVNLGQETAVYWKEPQKSKKVKLQNDLGFCSFSYTNSPDENVWLGNQFPISDTTTLTSVEIQTDAYILASDLISIDVFDHNEELLVSSELFTVYEDSLIQVDIPNIVVYDTIYVMVHWKDNPASTHALCVDFSDPNIANSARIKYPNQPMGLFTDFLGGGAPNMSFLIRVHTLDVANPVVRSQNLTYNLYRGLASEFPDTQNWQMINQNPLTNLSLIDQSWTSQDSTGRYRYAVETIYTEGNSAFTFSNPIDWTMLTALSEGFTDVEIAVYPIPAKDFIWVEIASKSLLTGEIGLYDEMGRMISSIDFPANSKSFKASQDISQLAAGNYFVRIDLDGKPWFKKIMVLR